MASDANDNVADFNKFRESMYQYLNEPIKDFAAIKPQLLDIFKTHRPIRNVDYQYGLSKSLKGKSQLIVHEFNKNRSAVREYFKAGNQVWHCCECTRTAAASKNDDGIIDLIVVHGIVFVKLEHDCKPRDLSFVQKVQKLYKEKKVEEADALQKEVLGSEDLNVPVKQKSGTAGKRGTNSSSKIKKDIISEIRLRYTEPTNDDVGQNSTTDELFDKNAELLPPEVLLAKIIENLEEYTNESKEVLMANKSKLLSILKSNHPVKLCNYQYGLTQNLRTNRRLLVFEWTNQRKIREFSKTNWRENLWRCLTCEVRVVHELQPSSSYLYLVSGIVFVPNCHDCEPRDYQLTMIYQKFLENGDTTKARAMAKKISFAYGQSLVNIINDLNCSTTESKTFINEIEENDESDSKTLTNLKRKLTSVNENGNPSVKEKLPASKRSRLDNTVINENDPGLLDEKLSIRNKSKSKNCKQHVCDKIDSSIHPTSSSVSSTAAPSIYHFKKPSTSKLQEICDKLNIEYRNKAGKLWDKIIFDQIDTVSSVPTETHYFETDNFYQILSIFFTGKSKQHEQIKATITDAFREKMVSLGDITTKTFNKQYLDTVMDDHFSFIAKYLSCRILIFDGKEGVKKYGKWKSTINIRLTLVVALRDGYYSIVLSL